MGWFVEKTLIGIIGSSLNIRTPLGSVAPNHKQNQNTDRNIQHRKLHKTKVIIMMWAIS